jgi:hypothetical protein
MKYNSPCCACFRLPDHMGDAGKLWAIGSPAQRQCPGLHPASTPCLDPASHPQALLSLAPLAPLSVARPFRRLAESSGHRRSTRYPAAAAPPPTQPTCKQLLQPSQTVWRLRNLLSRW